jgi:hypothetical protein
LHSGKIVGVISWFLKIFPKEIFYFTNTKKESAFYNSTGQKISTEANVIWFNNLGLGLLPIFHAVCLTLSQKDAAMYQGTFYHLL